MSFVRFSPWKSRSALRPPPPPLPFPDDGGRAAILRHETLHAGPGLDQRAVDREVLARQQRAHLRQVQHAGMNLAAISPSSSRSRFLQNTVASHTGSSADSPTNQRNNRL